MAFEGTQRRESIEDELSRAEAELRTTVRRIFDQAAEHRPIPERVEARQSNTDEASRSKIQKLHERLMGYGLVPATLAFTGFGYIKNNAGELGQLDTSITKFADPVGFETWQVPDLGIVQSFAESGMHTAAAAATIIILIAGANSGEWFRKKKS